MPICIQSLPAIPLSRTLAPSPRSSSKKCALSTCWFLCSYTIRPSHEKRIGFRWKNRQRKFFSGSDGVNSSLDAEEDGIVKKRNIVEHILLLRAKTDLSDDEEKEMLDHLYTSQYQMRGILAISLGRIAELNADDFTHAVYMRFQNKDDLENFYVNPYYSGVLKGHVIPYCYVCPGMG